MTSSTVTVGPPPFFHRSDCHICLKQDGLKTGSALLDTPTPGGHIVDAEHFIAEHAPLQASGPGTVIVEARRHFLDFGDMRPDESAELGDILRRLVPVIKGATGAERVYYLALMERSAHFHLWLVPKQEGSELIGVAYLAQQPPLTSTPASSLAMSTKIRTAFEDHN